MRPAWTDGVCSVFVLSGRSGQPAKFLYRYENLAEARIDFRARIIDLWPLAPGCTEATLEHFVADVLLPGILDHEGRLVLHAAAVIIDGYAAVLIGESGRGKSTLTASFYAQGHTVLSDDGIFVTCTETGANAEAVYPGIRLLPITLSALFADPILTTEVAHYAAKRRIVPDERMSPASFPAAALFFLADPSGTNNISVTPMSAADACIGIISKSFALDPSDQLRARSRFLQASRVANTLPIFALDYPRQISALHLVREAVADILSVTRAKS